MEELVKFTLSEWPTVSSYLVLLAMLLCFLGLPMGVLLWLFKFMNKERYIFEKSGEQLYRLDTIDGKIHKAEGRTFIEVKVLPPPE